jgi:hypothetical protein
LSSTGIASDFDNILMKALTVLMPNLQQKNSGTFAGCMNDYK